MSRILFGKGVSSGRLIKGDAQWIEESPLDCHELPFDAIERGSR